ncbi:MAG: hypothetical protein KGZ49_00335, partial [Syntrophaceae bacterium]|nr:hypothetical protein [Syntrophaceae bacterium]
MEVASDSNLSVPLRRIERPLQLGLFRNSEEERIIVETKETIPPFWKEVTDREWNDWRWQLRHRITTLDQLREIIQLT